MKNDGLVKSWIEFSDADAAVADFTFANMHPKPLGIICYHCQQAAGKALKALIVATLENADVPKTHDLALLADMLSEQFELNNVVYNACSDLTPYGVRIRYPKEIAIDDALTQKALADKKRVVEWVKEKISALR